MTTSTYRPTDASGRFVSRTLAATWRDTCAWCGLTYASHDDGVCRDEDRFPFEPSLPSGCLDARRHNVGCDCAAGVCK